MPLHSLRPILAVLTFAAALAAQTPRTGTEREGYANLPGVRIWYKDTGGSGVPVVLLHAATGSSQVWEHQVPAFTAAGYRVIAYDRRGWGRSVIDSTGPQPGTAADDLQALMDYLHIDRFHAIATAAGVSVTLDYAISFPQRVRSMVVANGAMGGLQDEGYMALYQRVRSPLIDALPPELRELGASYRAANPEGTRRWVELEHISRPAGPAHPQTTRNTLTFSLLQTLKVPMLVIAGDADLLAPPPFLRLFTSRIKTAESMIIPEAGHSAYWEQPEMFNRAVLEFIRKH